MNKAIWMTTALATILSSAYACSSNPSAPGSEATPSDSDTNLDPLAGPDLSDAQLTTLSGEQAMLRVLLTDAPVDAEHVYVTFCGVRVQSRGVASETDGSLSQDAGAATDHRSDAGEATEEVADAGAPTDHGDGEGSAGRDDAGARPALDGGAESPVNGWISLGDDCQTFDLLALQHGITAELGFDALPPGSYGQIRLMLREARIVVDGNELPLTVPSGEQSGIKIVHGFELQAGSLTTLALDFDAARSIRETGTGEYIMRPVIELIGDRRETFQDVTARESARSAESSSKRSEAEASESRVEPRDQAVDAGAATNDVGRGERGESASHDVPRHD
jgi:uncharacterized protein DUF4382